MEVTKENFLNDVKNHQLEVLQDNGLYRHLKIRNPECSNQWYQITTWPDYLCISGDMGCFTFQRTEDMFQFFRSAELRINTGYWAEKIQAGADYMSAKGVYSRFDIDLAIQHLKDYIKDLVDDGENQEELEEKFQCALNADDEYGYVESLRNIDFDFCDWPSCESTSVHYIWCCYAICHAINLYDQRINLLKLDDVPDLYFRPVLDNSVCPFVKIKHAKNYNFDVGDMIEIAKAISYKSEKIDNHTLTLPKFDKTEIYKIVQVYDGHIIMEIINPEL